MRVRWLVLVGLLVGVAPISPEPHLLEKIRWVYLWRGLGMGWLDAFDLVFHAAWLALALGLLAREAWRWGRGTEYPPPTEGG